MMSSNTTAATTMLRRIKISCRSKNNKIVSIPVPDSSRSFGSFRSMNDTLLSPAIFHPSVSTTSTTFSSTFSIPAYWPFWETETYYSRGSASCHDKSSSFWQFAIGMGFALMSATTTLPTLCDNGVVVNPAVEATDSKTNKTEEKSHENENVESVSESISEQNQQQQQQQQQEYDANLLKRIAKRTLQMERWLGELCRDQETLARYRQHQAQQQLQLFNNNSTTSSSDTPADATMSKPDLMMHVAQKIIELDGWGTSPDLVPLVVGHLEEAGLPKYTKEELVTLYNMLRVDSLMFRETGPCLPFYRALYECLMMQPTNVEAVAPTTTTSIQPWIAPAIADICPLHVQTMRQCLDENQNMIQIIRNQKDYEHLQRGLLLPRMIEKAEKVEWTRLPFTLDYTPWRDYFKVRGWSVADLEKRLQAEQQWRKDTFSNSTRGQPYWEQVQHDWNDVPVVTLHVDLPRVDRTTGYRLIKAWACDVNMTPPPLPLVQPDNSDDKQLHQQQQMQQPLILGLCDGNPSDNRRSRHNKTVALPISTLAGRTEAIQVFALYADYKTTMNADQARLYHTPPLSLVRPLLK